MLKITTILLLSLLLRFYGLDWDQGFHLHPDERMLIMVADRINFFGNLNPEFFNYGSLPIYFLKGIVQFLDFIFRADFSNYSGLLYMGRYLSIIADLTIIYLIFLISKQLFKNEKIALLSSFIYAVSFFPIQNSHFFIVDVFLNLFAALLVYLTILYLEKPSLKKIILISLVLGAALATKFTAIIFVPIVITALLIRRNNTRFVAALAVTAGVIFFYFIFMPYAFLSYEEFFRDVLIQAKMNSNAYIFPYTLQYVGTLPYLYYLKNIFLWGLGPIIGVLTLIGIVMSSNLKIKSSKLFFLIFYLVYFAVIGQSAVKFMRYMLPMYPFFAIMAGYGLFQIQNSKFKIQSYLLLTGALIWTFSFMNIYSKPNTRVTATNWILKNIPAGSALAVEHWDDRIPIYQSEKYSFVEMTLYNVPDDDRKWEMLNQNLDMADYIVIASNRLYVPLQKLKDCKKYKVCYPKTAKYYEDLFSGKLGFKKIAEFASYPRLEIGNLKLEINDTAADESFTVYDHPKITIFKKN